MRVCVCACTSVYDCVCMYPQSVIGKYFIFTKSCSSSRLKEKHYHARPYAYPCRSISRLASLHRESIDKNQFNIKILAYPLRSHSLGHKMVLVHRPHPQAD